MWWREAVFYQIYPLSFADSNEDGFGDLPGIINRLPYLSDVLGVDGIWLSPFFKSPLDDWGYDVSDHKDVDPTFGTLADAEELIARAHDLQLKVIIDYVANHTSDQHPWFIESRSERNSAKRDWYVWRDGRNGGPPNNWVSVFSGPAWSLDQATGQWYRHTYLPSQPDLNWRNPDVAEAMLDVARFWLDRGVDGFRVDAAHQMMKDERERDNPPAPRDYERPYKDMGEYDNFIHLYDLGQPGVHDIHRKLRAVTDEYERDALTIGEVHIFDLPEWATYYGEDFDQLSMPFNFQLMTSEWNAPSLRATIESVLWNVPKGGWTNWTLGNHDEHRIASRLPKGHERLAALLILTLRGTPFLYYGDEIGMVQGADVGKDPWGNNVPELIRDGERTPMRWDPTPGAGFTSPSTEPWLPINGDVGKVNVETQLDEPDSILNMYRRLLRLRARIPTLRLGSYETHPESSDDVLIYGRKLRDETVLVSINLGHEAVLTPGGVVAFSTIDPNRGGLEERVMVEPGEGVIVISG